MAPAAKSNKRVIRKFRDAGAVGPAKAVTARDVGLWDNRSMNRYVRCGLLERDGEKYYIPEALTKTHRWVMMFGKGAGQ